MLNSVFVIYDTKAQSYNKPIFSPTLETLKRNYVELVQSGDKSLIVTYPQDFELYCLGTYDDMTLVFDIFPEKQLIGRLNQMLPSGNEEQ
jgi:hypothetical protein